MKAKPISVGDRCIIIHSYSGNEGRIVVVVADLGHMVKGNRYMVGGHRFKSTRTGRVVVIQSLGSPLNVCRVGQTTVCRTDMVRPASASQLRRLPDVKDDVPVKEETV